MRLLFKLLFKPLAVLGSLALGLLALRLGVQRRVLKNAERRTAPNGISSPERVMLGGVEQWILIQGEDRTKPVFLVLHGGPGMPFPGVSYRSRSLLGQEVSEFAKHFVVVYWDQRECGKSGGPDVSKESITLEQLISDTAELADLLRACSGWSRSSSAASRGAWSPDWPWPPGSPRSSTPTSEWRRSPTGRKATIWPTGGPWTARWRRATGGPRYRPGVPRGRDRWIA